MVKLGKLGVACALCLTMSLSLFTSGAFAQSARQNTANKVALTMTANSAFQNNANMQANGWGGDCGFGFGCGDGFGGGCFSCGHGLSHSRFVRFTRIVHITRITQFVRFEHFHHSNWGGGCGSCGWGGGWIGGGGADW